MLADKDRPNPDEKAAVVTLRLVKPAPEPLTLEATRQEEAKLATAFNATIRPSVTTKRDQVAFLEEMGAV